MIPSITDQFHFDPQSLRDLTNYLLATGWKRIKYQNRRLAVYAKELEELSDTPVEYSVRWSLSLSPSPDVAQVSPIVLDKGATSYLCNAAQYLEAVTPNS